MLNPRRQNGKARLIEPLVEQVLARMAAGSAPCADVA